MTFAAAGGLGVCGVRDHVTICNPQYNDAGEESPRRALVSDVAPSRDIEQARSMPPWRCRLGKSKRVGLV